MNTDPRRTYYDHEPAYRARRAKGFRGWSVASHVGAYDRYHIDRATGVDANRTRIWVSQARVLDEFARAGLQVRNVQRHGPPNADESGDELVVEATRE